MIMPIHDGLTAFEIVTAKSIYTNEHHVSLWKIKKLYWEFKKLMFIGDDQEIQIQAWQYVKAYTKILKDKDEWDEQSGVPMPGPEWLEIDPKSTEWLDYYKAHPTERLPMYRYKREFYKQKGE